MSRDEATGRFLPGNRFWEARSSAGPKPKFDNGDALWSACLEYFAWCHDNPLYEDKLVTFQGMATHEPVAKMRAMTIAGLCLFLDVTQKQWIEWREKRADLSEVIAQAEAVIYQQKFAGAAADLLNANIIARDLGLADKQDHQSTDGSMTPQVITRRVVDLKGDAD
ncbi:terminase small subunit [Sagittula sp. S175]|uniref:terminase small subunit n=1 Tax=Sagittula sp. S175 TaxID=3415129 RepID=UPI003C7BF25E